MAPFVLTASSIIAAVGQKPDFEPFKGDESIKLNKYGYMECDPYTLMTSKPGVFVGGDAVSGGGTVIEAINAGKVAAKYIDKYLRGEPVVEDIEDKTRRIAVYLGAQKSARAPGRVRGLRHSASRCRCGPWRSAPTTSKPWSWATPWSR